MRQHILIVEHSQKVRTALCKLFSRAGMKTCSAASVETALAKLACIPALVVLDMDLPDGSGVEVLKAIRGVGLESEIAVIAGAADASEEGWIQNYRPDAIFGKPLDMDDLVDWLSGFDQSHNLPLRSPAHAEFAIAA